MDRALGKRLPLAVLLLLAAAGIGRAQGPAPDAKESRSRIVSGLKQLNIHLAHLDPPDNPSHKNIPAPEVDPAQLMLRWQQVQDRLKVQKDLKKLIDEIKNRPDLLKQDPDSRKKLEEVVKNSGVKLDPNDPLIRDAVKMLKNLTGQQGQGPKVSPEMQEELQKWLKLLQDMQQRQAAQSGPQPNPPGPNGDPSVTPPNAGPQLDPEERQSRERFNQWLREQAERLNRDTLNNSDAIRQIRQDLERYAKNDNFKGLSGWGKNGEWGKRLAELTKDVRPNQLLGKIDLPHLPRPNISLPSQSLPGLPKIGPIGRPPSVNMPNFGSPTLPSGGAPSGDGLIYLLTLLVGGLLAWRFFRAYAPALRQRLHDNLPVAWPVPPDAVATREELIRAFEHLSLLKLGPDARMWNHREIAVGLGGSAEERRRAADVLADLYEQARYAPGAEPLPEPALRAARTSLTVLAGGSA